MSGLFGRKGSDSSAERRQAIKRYLNTELSRNIKKLQKDHISSASAIRSGETVNRLCSCLEAIFLHELKESYSSKTFWPFVTKFTHRDVLEQIKQLLFIRTEIGKCRAWIRMAVNDCLMDSYLSAMLREPSTLKQYYKQGAFLRDSELPLIANDYLQGLTVFTLQLSCNSSVLNMWDTALLLLSGANLSKEKEAAEDTPTVSSTEASKKLSNTSFHESEMSPSLLVEETTESAAQGQVSTLDVGSPVRVQELDDSLVIDFLETAGDHSRTNLAKGSEDPEQAREPSKPDSPSDVTERNAERDGVNEPRQPPESLNPFVSSSSMQDGGELVFSRQKATVGKGKKKKKGKKEVEVVTLPESTVDGSEEKEERGGRSGGITTAGTKEVGRTAQDGDGEPEASQSPSNASEKCREDGHGGMDSQNNEDLYKTQTDGNPCDDGDRKTVIHQEANGMEDERMGRAKNGLEEEDVYRSGGVLRGDDEAPRHGDERQSGEEGGQPISGEEGQRSKEESFEGSFGNSLTGMQGWSSDFERMPAPEHAEKSVVESQESYSTMVGKYIQNTSPSISVPESLIQSDETEKEVESEDTKQERTQELLDMITKIGLEKGLAAQKFQCRGCSCELGIIFGKHRVCNYNGFYYCSECHLDEQAVIPARILYNWDFRKHPVACHTKLFLNQIEDMPLIDVVKCNPSLYSAISEMEQILELRKQLVYLKAYLFTCKESVAEELRSKIWPRDYMLENFHLYSVKDFLQVQNGSLGPQLKKVIVFAAKHVQQCALCSQKGFICEICENPKIIYPFDTELTVRCEKCRSVYHKACKTDIKPCPRCLRRKVKSPGEEGNQEHTQFPSPFT